MLIPALKETKMEKQNTFFIRSIEKNQMTTSNL